MYKRQDGSSEVKGAKLYILNENQEVMESWTSGDQPHYVEKLPIGTYTLLEETAPKGYIVANKVTFEIKDTGDIQGAKMEDEQAMGKVILNKTDKDTKKPMKGVESVSYTHLDVYKRQVLLYGKITDFLRVREKRLMKQLSGSC